MKDLTRWGRDYLQVGNAMEVFRRNNVRFIAVNNGIDSDNPDTLEFAPFINIMSEWYAKDISKKVKTGIRTKGASGKPIATEAPYGYMKDPNNKDFWIIDEEAAEVVRLIFRLFIGGKNRNQIAVYMLNQANGDRQILAKQLNISPHQLSYVTHSGEGEGLLFFGNVILPFVDHFPKDLELYRILTTRLSEVVEAKHE